MIITIPFTNKTETIINIRNLAATVIAFLLSGPGGEVWKLEENLYPFVKLCAGVLSDKPLFVLINSYTTGLAPSVLGYLLNILVASKYGGKCTWDELGLPVTETGLALPCGATGRWFSE